MINDLITAFLVALAAVTASELLVRIWEYFWVRTLRTARGDRLQAPGMELIEQLG
jgi:hypothetical protein